MAAIQLKPVGVFWDIENCPIPKGKLASDVIAHIRNFFVINRLNHREYEFIISCDVTRLMTDIPEDINKAGGVTLAHVNGSSKNAADEKLRESMKKFVDTHASASSVSPILILISGDIDFVNDLRGYQTRLGFSVILLHATSCSPQFKVGWNEIYPFTSFCSAVKDQSTSKSFSKKHLISGGPPNPKPHGGGPSVKFRGSSPNHKNESGGALAMQTKNPKANKQAVAQLANKFEKLEPRDKRPKSPHPTASVMGQSPVLQPSGEKQQDQHPNRRECRMSVAAAEKTAKNKYILMVGGLPGKLDFKILKENLQFQANKVQGKVKFVKNGQAFITFKNKFNADRAVELFNGKQIFGKSLSVSFTKAIPFENPAGGKAKSGPDGFVNSKKGQGGEGTNKTNNKNAGLNKDPVLSGLGTIIGGMVADRVVAATISGNKTSESCPIQ